MILKSKCVFLILCVAITIIGAEIAISIQIHAGAMQLLISIFQMHFLIVLNIWILIAGFHVKNWLLTGLVGSTIYTSMYLFCQYFVNTENSYDSIWKGAVIVIEVVLAATLGALPQWFVLRKVIPTANKWLIVNSTGYGIISFYGWFRLFAFKQWVLGPSGRDNPILYQILQHMAGHQFTTEVIFISEFGLLGIILGMALIDLFKNE